MSFRKFKKILVQVLMLTLLLPNVSVNAEDNYSNSDVQEQVSEDTLNYENSEENIQNNVTEDKSIQDDTEGKTEDSIEPEVKVSESLETKKSTVVDTEVIEDSVDIEVIEGSIVGEEYKSKKIDIPYVETEYSDLSERIEYKLKVEALNNITILETKTDSEYEIALAHEDGSFTYVSSVESIEEALDEVQTLTDDLEKDPEGTVDKLTNMSSKSSSFKLTNLNTLNSYSSTQATVINNNGQVVYSNNAMARIVKYINGKPDTTGLKTTTLYSDSALSKSSGYVNHMYVEDAPILEDNGNSAKILVSGLEAWINKNTSNTEYDMVVVPLNQVKNPSYYIVMNGELRHFISSDITGTSGHTITIGKAPSYLTAGVRYFSYDGIYFYNGEDIETGLNNLMNDYKSGSRARSVNPNNPHYLYYNYLPFRSKTVYTAVELNKAIEANTQTTSKLRGIGEALKDAEQTYGVNAILALGVAINESAWGMSPISQSKNNLFGLNAVDSNPTGAADTYTSPSASVTEFSKNYISRGYADPADWRYNGGFLGNKKLGANVRYASDPYWGEKAAQHAFTIDKYLSRSVSSLLDTDLYQLAIYEGTNEVRDSSGNILYAIDNYWSFVGTPFVLTNKSPVTINGSSLYEIYPERTNAATLGKFDGNYNWNTQGYIKTSGVKLINSQKNLKPPVSLLAGPTRHETAVALSKSKFNSSDTVILVNHAAVIDGVTASPLATYLKAPILLTDPNVLSPATKNEIIRLKAKKIIIVGSEGIVGKSIVSQLNSIGITNVVRVAGNDRYETSLAVAKYIDKYCYDVSEVFIVYGHGEPDAVSISSVSGKNKIPIILTPSNAMRSDTLSWLKSENLKTGYVIGSAGIIANNVLNQLNSVTSSNVSNNRIWGSTRFETNAAVINKFFGETVPYIYCTEAIILIDPLTAGPIAALDEAPIVLIRGDLVKEQKNILSKMYSKKIIQVGNVVDKIGLNSLRSIVKMYKL